MSNGLDGTLATMRAIVAQMEQKVMDGGGTTNELHCLQHMDRAEIHLRLLADEFQSLRPDNEPTRTLCHQFLGELRLMPEELN